MGKLRISKAGLQRFIVYPFLAVAASYIFISYMLMPEFWEHFEHHPSLGSVQKITYTREGIKGDPVNIAVAASETGLVEAMISAGWTLADRVTLKSSVKAAVSFIFKKNYASAPVSDLFFYGKREDLAFEIETDPRIRKRHHVRFWRTNRKSASGAPLWMGAASFDNGIELSRYTGKITHRISPDIDAERDMLIESLLKTGIVEKYYQVSGLGPVISGRNGCGDPYFTDGEISVVALNPAAITAPAVTARLKSPAIIETKNSLFRSFKNFLKFINRRQKPS